MMKRAPFGWWIAFVMLFVLAIVPSDARADDPPKQEELPRRQANFVWATHPLLPAQVIYERLKARKLATSRWKTGANRLDRLLGKELCVLAWAAETARPARGRNQTARFPCCHCA